MRSTHCLLFALALAFPAMALAQPDPPAAPSDVAPAEAAAGEAAQGLGEAAGTAEAAPGAQDTPNVAGPQNLRRTLAGSTDSAQQQRMLGQGQAPAQGSPHGAIGQRQAVGSPHGSMGQGAGAIDDNRLMQAVSPARPTGRAQASEMLPAGTIRIQVRQMDGAPIANQIVVIAERPQMGEGRTHRVTTNERGEAMIDSLPTGSGQAYRVKTHREGARFAAPPFQLPPDKGYVAQLLVLPTTTNKDVVLQFLGRTMTEFKEGRMHVVQQAQLANLSQGMYVFPQDGLEIELPADFLNFQTAQMMSDQRLERSDAGFKMMGSLPPGRTDITWAYDLPLDGERFELSQPVPFRTYVYRVLAESSAGMTMSVEGMGDVRSESRNGRQLLIAETARSPDDAMFERLEIRLNGIPGPGPARWLAVFGALAFLLGAFILFKRQESDGADIETARAAKREQLIADAEALKASHERGDIGDRYYEKQRQALVSELALSLRASSMATQASSSDK